MNAPLSPQQIEYWQRCFAMELDAVYCDVAVRRWEMATGRKATNARN